MRKLTTEEFIRKAKEIHGDKYDFSKVNYINAKEKVCIICHKKDDMGQEHGEFYIRPCNVINGTGCPKCGNRFTYTREEWIAKANFVHSNKYDYSLIESTNGKAYGTIICPIHGQFKQQLGSHINGCGCPKCNKGVPMTLEEFTIRANEIHHQYYDYSKFTYVNQKTKGIIICPRHGSFMQTPDIHLRGHGCPKCKSSKLESIVLNALNRCGISYIYQSNVLKNDSFVIDFYIKNTNLLIECQGEQHFVPVDFSRKNNMELAKSQFEKQIVSDIKKYETAKQNGFEVIYFTIPSYFRTPDINIRKDFYKDKMVFTDIDRIIGYIETRITKKDNKLFEDFKENIIKITNGNIVLLENNQIKYRNYIITFNYIMANEHDTLNSITRSYRKRNINVIHIFEDEYLENKTLVLRKLRHIFKLNYDLPKIVARKCNIRPIYKYEANEFLVANHIQGFVPSTLYLGAFFNEKLVAVMTFTKEDWGKWTLTRFASDNNYISSGVGGKLFKYFIRTNCVTSVKSFADKRWTIDKNDNLYTRLNFKIEKETFPDYRYIDNSGKVKKRFHKFGFRKDILQRKYKLDPNMTELEMTRELGYDRIWDCGLIKYVYYNEKQ